MNVLQAERRVMRGNLLIPIALVLTVIACKWPILHVPYYWDEAGAYFAPSLWLSGRELVDAFPGRHPDGMFFGHPPLLYLLMALLFKLFGHAPAVAHLVVILFAALAVFYTYRLGDLLFSRDTAIGAALLLLTSPLFFSQAGMFLGDIPVAACGVGAVYYYLRRCHCRYLLFATAAVMIKEHAALLVVLLVVYDCNRFSGQQVPTLNRLVHGIPLAILGTFFLVQKLTTGVFLSNPYFDGNPFIATSMSTIVFKGAFVTYWIFFAQGRFLLSLVIAVAVWRFRRALPGCFFLFTMIAGGYLAAYTIIYFIPRYSLIVAPFVCLAGSASAALLVKERQRFALVVAVLCLVSIFFPDIRSKGYDNFETSMQYLDVIAIYRDAADFLQRTASDDLICAPWPLSKVWTEPSFGYVSSPLNATMDPATPWTYLVFTPQADRSQSEAIDGLLSGGGAEQVEKIARFERSGKVIDLFRRKNSTPNGKGI